MPRISANAFNLGIPGGVLFIQFYEHRRPATRSQSSASIAKMASGTSTTPPRQRECGGRRSLAARARHAAGPRSPPLVHPKFGTELETSMGRARELLITGITRNGLVTSY
jgi:hypothetical protein